MNTEALHKHLSADAHAALFDAAKQGALQARREAERAFWSGVARSAGSLWRAVWRGTGATDRSGSVVAAACAAAARKRASDLQTI